MAHTSDASGTLGHRVKQVLRHGIVSGTFPGRTRLVQSIIADELGVNTAAVREALRELAAEGLIRIGRRGEAVVPEMCRGELEDIYQIRMTLEPIAAARAAASATPASVLAAVGSLAAMQAETDVAAWASCHHDFHRVIDEAGNGPGLVDVLANLRNRSARYVAHSIMTAPDRAGQAGAEDEQILRAIIARDPDAAACATLCHLGADLDSLGIRPFGGSSGRRAGVPGGVAPPRAG